MNSTILDVYHLTSINQVMILIRLTDEKTHRVLYVDSHGLVSKMKTFTTELEAVSLFERDKGLNNNGTDPWKPINTVPKDGRKIIVLDKSGKVSELYANPEGFHHFQENYVSWDNF